MLYSWNTLLARPTYQVTSMTSNNTTLCKTLHMSDLGVRLHDRALASILVAIEGKCRL